MKTIKRIFIPGDEWIYFKIYTGTKTADDILIQVVLSIIKNLKKKQYIDKWFFIRYSDPDFHLRVRMLLSDTSFVGKVVSIFYNKLSSFIKSNLIWKTQLDTYNRELERYGKHLIEETESFFCADSECTLSIIRKLNDNDNYRWMIALKLINELLSDFDLSIEEKQKMMENLSESYKIEFGFNEFNSKQFNNKYRDNKNTIESVLKNTIVNEEFVALYLPINEKSKKLASIIEQLNLKLKRNKMKITLNDLLSSYIHMMLNRLFRSKGRIHELILYDFMVRFYASEIARNKYNPL